MQKGANTLCGNRVKSVKLCFAICEDETYFASRLREMLLSYFQERLLEAEICLFASGEELICSGRRPDVVLMDIKLPGRNGLEIVERLQRAGADSPVIFITAYKEYVFRAFDLEAAHYILKPVRKEKLYQALDRALRRIKAEEGKTIWIAQGSRAFRLRFREILYCEVFDHETFIYTASERFRFPGTLEALEKELDGRFFRCHRSYLVNMDCVTEKGAGFAVVAGGGKVLVSKRREGAFRKRLLKSCKEQED